MIGYTDEPLENADEECLGVGEYSNALATFITHCNTPLTIAIQGDWGTGKTSMMNLVRQQLVGRQITCAWFNTWQFSQFAMQDEVPVTLIMELLTAVNFDKAELGKLALDLVRRIAILGAGVVGGADASTAVSNATEADPLALATQLRQLKQSMKAAVDKKLAETKTSRMVIFIDDLDRMKPEKAVELLEVVKNFMDIQGCVFVLAVDYGVVSRGIREKYGETMDDIKGRSFFDKIIQLPFNLPVSQYDIRTYMSKILVKAADEDPQIYLALAESSVGTNPRTLKRMSNAMDLLSIVAKNKLPQESEQPKFRQMLFGVLCLQMAYEPVYTQILMENLGGRLFQDSDATPREELFAKSLALCPGKKEDVGERFHKFMQALTDALPSLDEHATDEQDSCGLQLFTAILHFSGLTSSAAESAPPESPSSGFDPQLNAVMKTLPQAIQARYPSYMALLDAWCNFADTSFAIDVNISPHGDSIVLAFVAAKTGIQVSLYAEEYVDIKRETLAIFKRLLPEKASQCAYNGRAYNFMKWPDIPWSGEAAAPGETSRITQTKRVVFEWLDTILPALEAFYAPKMDVLHRVFALRGRLDSRLKSCFPAGEQSWILTSSKICTLRHRQLVNLRKPEWPEGFQLMVRAEGSYVTQLSTRLLCNTKATNDEAKELIASLRQKLQTLFVGRMQQNDWWLMWADLPEALRNWTTGQLESNTFAYLLSPEQEEAMLARVEEDLIVFRSLETELDALAAALKAGQGA